MAATTRAVRGLFCASLLIILAGAGDPAVAQTGCTPPDTAVTGWLQGVIDGAISVHARDALGLTHLAGQGVGELGNLPGDDSTCDAIIAGLPDDERNSLGPTLTAYRVLFFSVGNRYLLVWTRRPETPRQRPTIVVSFDSQFKKINAVMW